MHREDRLCGVGLLDPRVALMDGDVALPVQRITRSRGISRSVSEPALHIRPTSATRCLDSESRGEYGLAVAARVEVRLHGTRVRLGR